MLPIPGELDVLGGHLRGKRGGGGEGGQADLAGVLRVQLYMMVMIVKMKLMIGTMKLMMRKMIVIMVKMILVIKLWQPRWRPTTASWRRTE